MAKRNGRSTRSNLSSGNGGRKNSTARSYKYPKAITIHHIQPRSRGGSDDE